MTSVADPTPWCFLVNPTAAGGRGLGRWRRIAPRLERAFPHSRAVNVITGKIIAPGNCVIATYDVIAASDVIAHLLITGHRHFVGVGGDGTHHRLSALLYTTPGVIYAPLPAGSGNDWVRTLGTPHRLEAWIDMLRRRRTMDHRIGLFDGRPFLNILGLCYDAAVVKRTLSLPLPLRHRLIYPLATLAGLRSYRAPTLRLTYDGTTVEGRFHTINIGLGRFNGGGMQLVPQADPESGQLGLTFVPLLPIYKVLLHGWRFYFGKIAGAPGAVVTRAETVRIEVLEGVLEAEADGEFYGPGVREVRLAGATLRVVVP